MKESDIITAIALLEQGVTHDLGFAAAWGLLAQAYVLAPIFSPELRGSCNKMADSLRNVSPIGDSASVPASGLAKPPLQVKRGEPC